MAFPTRTPAPVTRATRDTLPPAPARRGPERLVAPGPPVREPRRDEEEVGEPVQVGEDRRIHLDLGGEEDRAPLRAPADGAREMERGGGSRPAGQDEAGEQRQLGLPRIDR